MVVYPHAVLVWVLTWVALQQITANNSWTCPYPAQTAVQVAAVWQIKVMSASSLASLLLTLRLGNMKLLAPPKIRRGTKDKQ
jgi:hypothetical protein